MGDIDPGVSVGHEVGTYMILGRLTGDFGQKIVPRLSFRTIPLSLSFEVFGGLAHDEAEQTLAQNGSSWVWVYLLES